MNETDWARSRPSNIQHAEKRPHPMRPVDAGWISIGVILVAAGAVIAASFSPLWATKLVSFAGAEVGTALHHRFPVRDQFSRASTASAPVRTAARIVKVGR